MPAHPHNQPPAGSGGLPEPPDDDEGCCAWIVICLVSAVCFLIRLML